MKKFCIFLSADHSLGRAGGFLCSLKGINILKLKKLIFFFFCEIFQFKSVVYLYAVPGYDWPKSLDPDPEWIFITASEYTYFTDHLVLITLGSWGEGGGVFFWNLDQAGFGSGGSLVNWIRIHKSEWRVSESGSVRNICNLTEWPNETFIIKCTVSQASHIAAEHQGRHHLHPHSQAVEPGQILPDESGRYSCKHNIFLLQRFCFCFRKNFTLKHGYE